MSYDNSQLARVYLHAWQVTGNEFSRTIAEDILDYVVREMLHPDGGFYSTQDADSGGEEGKLFVWTPDEIREVLGGEANAFMAAYGVTPVGNFEGKNILEFVGDMDQRAALTEARRKLFEAREQRIHYLVEGLLELYQTTFEPRWFVAARELAEMMLTRFGDSGGTLYDTSDDQEVLITRPRDLQDNATPSGNAMAVTTLLKLAGFTNDLRYVDIAHQALTQMQPMMSQYRLSFGQWLQALATPFRNRERSPSSAILIPLTPKPC